MKNFNVINDEKNFFDQPVKSLFRSYENIQKITTMTVITELIVPQIIQIPKTDLGKQQEQLTNNYRARTTNNK